MKKIINFKNFIAKKFKIAKLNLDYELYNYFNDETGAGVIELVLILVVLIGLVIVFKDKIGTLLEGIFTNINKSADSIYNN